MFHKVGLRGSESRGESRGWEVEPAQARVSPWWQWGLVQGYYFSTGLFSPPNKKLLCMLYGMKKNTLRNKIRSWASKSSEASGI